MSVSRNSSAAGWKPSRRMREAARMQLSASIKGRMSETSHFALGMSRTVSSVTTPSVPSEPMMSCSRSMPELFFPAAPPSVSTSPEGRTTTAPVM